MSRDHLSVHTAATSNASTSATNGINSASSGSSANSIATVIVAVVVGLLLLAIIVWITITEHRKKKTSEGLRVRAKEDKERALVGNGSSESFESFESELKEPGPAMKVFSYAK
ncbi:uncharacterized protein BDZ83DRAFT_752741 [Colletotrichum acutatum]|uniref:Uncharacterized protein n=1 Tax=Glomerella acutata TaxID=27357 RepID=A0AAD8UPT2_GLOAC|nr:uncharacterized protein BDZ83DRAFT_752741 [Colletotrichum acutatum]KAK1724240.1 hypothetical protein BDZ83DRAFT_752741 [Colletotrichum acutatum]